MKEKICSLENCFEIIRCKGYCAFHYQRHLQGVYLESPRKLPAKGQTCSIEACNQPVRCKMLCEKHYSKAIKIKKCPKCGEDRYSKSLMCKKCWLEESQKHIPTHKKCTRCDEEKPVEDFGLRKARGGSAKWRSRCRACEAAEQKERTQQKKLAGTLGVRNRDGEKKNRAVLAMKQYCEKLNLPWKLVIQQYPDDGLCKICNQEPSANHERLSLDHDHASGGFRGFICSKCNHLIGLANDNKEILRNAIKYLDGDQILPTP